MSGAGPTYMCPSLIFKIAGDKSVPVGNCGGLLMSVHKIAFLLGTILESELVQPVLAYGRANLGKAIFSK
jgi:hypothetical protein